MTWDGPRQVTSTPNQAPSPREICIMSQEKNAAHLLLLRINGKIKININREQMTLVNAGGLRSVF